MKVIEEQAEKVLSKCKIDTIPVDVFDIASKMDVQIQYAPSKDYSGLLFRKDKIAFMAISSSDSKTRQRFTVAHELGHFFLHQHKDTFIEFRKNSISGPKETEANGFAAALLMPRKFLEKDVRDCKDTGVTKETIKNFATKYDVSEEAMTFRLLNLHIIT